MVQKVSSSCTPLVHVPCWRLSCLWIVLCTPLWRPLSEKMGLSAETWPEEIQCFQTEADEETELFPNENTVSGTLPTGALASSSDELRWGSKSVPWQDVWESWPWPLGQTNLQGGGSWLAYLSLLGCWPQAICCEHTLTKRKHPVLASRAQRWIL